MLCSRSASSFEETFNKEICSILVEFLTIHEVFQKFPLLNKNFKNILESLKSFPKLWKIKYLQEFISTKDKGRKKYEGPEGEEKFMKLFRDNTFDPSGEETMYSFFRKSIDKQLRMRYLISNVIYETKRQTTVSNEDQTG